MIIGGNYTHHFQMGPPTPGQNMQAVLEAGSQGNDAFAQQASANVAHNLQNRVTTLKSAISRGQGLDMYV